MIAVLSEYVNLRTGSDEGESKTRGWNRKSRGKVGRRPVFNVKLEKLQLQKSSYKRSESVYEFGSQGIEGACGESYGRYCTRPDKGRKLTEY